MPVGSHKCGDHWATKLLTQRFSFEAKTKFCAHLINNTNDFFTSTLRCTICLCLTYCCLYVAFFSWDKYLKQPTTTKVSQVSLQSDDVPSFAICPQPSVNVNVLKHLIGFNVSVFHQSTICKMDGCDGLDFSGDLLRQTKWKAK